MRKGFWKRLPLHIKTIIIFWVGLVFIFFLLIMSCAGGADEFVEKLKTDAQRTSEYFDIEWSDGTKQDVFQFYELSYSEDALENQGRTVKEFYLVAKQDVVITFVKIETGDLNSALSVSITALDLPQAENDEYEVQDGKTGLAEYVAQTTGEPFLEIGTAKIKIPKDKKLHVVFDRAVYVDYIACDFTLPTAENPEQGQ